MLEGKLDTDSEKVVHNLFENTQTHKAVLFLFDLHI